MTEAGPTDVPRGSYCIVCRKAVNTEGPFKIWDKVFVTEDFLKHVETLTLEQFLYQDHQCSACFNTPEDYPMGSTDGTGNLAP